ncbi:MAG: tetratricopeptide repeat protein [Phycisphaerae bacterium]|nr:tetratricopeptide repeat protein [Phycisphaerae bacterium]
MGPMPELLRRRLVVPVAAALLGALAGSGCNSSNNAPPPEPDPETAELATMNAATQQVLRAQKLVNQGDELARGGRPLEAISRYREAIGVYQDFPAAWNNLGVVLMKQGRNLEAAEAFRVAGDLSPTDPKPMCNLGDLWFNQGYLDDAARFYGAALERDANYQPALRQAVRVDHLRQRSDEATAERIRKALLQESDPVWHQYLERRKLVVEQHLRDKGGKTP